MHLEGLAKLERNKVLTEIPKVKDEKGETTEVQVLEEGRYQKSMWACSTLMSSWRNWNSFNLNVQDVKYP